MNFEKNIKFIEKSKKIHGDRYCYDLVDYKRNNVKVKIVCKQHGVFLQCPNNHLNGCGCKECAIENQKRKNFTEEAKKIHGDEYCYDLADYKRNKDKVKIICKKHGEFLQCAISHLKGNGCSKCSKTHKSNTEEFIFKANFKHNNKYDYTLADYKLSNIKVKIICKQHGEFLQLPNRHLSGDGCPKCKLSKNELKIAKILDEYNLDYECQATFETCKNKRKLPFDFKIIKNKRIYLIEYNGEHHYELVNFSSNEIKSKKKYNQTKINDEIKQNWCKTNDIFLLIIPYWKKDQIKKEINQFLKNEVQNHDVKT